MPREGLQDGVVARVDAVRAKQPPGSRKDAALPVDERAVAVEGQDLEPVERERHGAETATTPGRASQAEWS